MTPALTHEDASGQLLDLVYGEAEGATRAALEAHVAGCAQCQADLAAMGQTHELLRGTFEDLPVPARAHARILEAARAAVAPAAKAAAAARAPVVAKPAAPSFWERMRGRWTLPTLATVGAVAVVVVSSRLFLDPNRAFEQMQERRAPAEAVAPAAEAPSAVAPAAPPTDEQAKAEHAIDEALHRHRTLEQLRSTPPGGRGALRSRSLDDRLRSAVEQLQGHGPDRGAGAGGVASGSIGGAAARRDELAKSAEAKAPAAEKADKVAAKPAAAPARNERAYASPPADWAPGGGPKGGAVAQAPAPAAPPPAPVAAPKAAKRSDSFEGLAGAPPPPASAAAPAKRKALMQKDEAESDDAPVASAAEPSAQPMEERARAKSDGTGADKKKEAAPTAEALARKAEQLFAAGRWDEAVAAYRDLLRRFPDADPAAQWRTRLIQAQRQQTAARDKAATKAAPAAQ